MPPALIRACSESDLPFDGTDGFEILIHLDLVIAPQTPTDVARVFKGHIQETTVIVGFVRAGEGLSIGVFRAEKSFVYGSRIDFTGDRHVRSTPCDVRCVKTRVADVGIDAGDDWINAKLQGWKRRARSDFHRGDLVQRCPAGTDIAADRLVDVQAGEKVGGLCVMAVAFVAVLFIET